MKKIILCVIAISSLFMASCNDYVSKYDGIIMVGNKPYKLVKVFLDGAVVKIIIPADSSISIVPSNVTYDVQKSTETILYVD
jgi:hypothetical protein